MISSTAFAQREVINGNQQWFQYYSSLKLSKKIGLYSDAGLRWRNGFGDISQTFLRTGLGYNRNEKLRLIAGFAFLTSFREGQLERFEYRPYQELAISGLFGKAKVQNRFRVEERFFRKPEHVIAVSNSFNFRFRYRFYATLPISGTESIYQWFLNVGDEVLVNAGEDVARNVFDSNRLLIGPAIQLGYRWTVSFTYNFTFAVRNEGSIISNAHILWLGIKHKI